MIKSIAGAAKRLLRNPLLLLPSLASVAILLVLAYLFAGFAIDLTLNAVFLEMVPDAPLHTLPFQFTALYGMQILGLFVFALLAGTLFTSLAYWYAAYVRMSLNNNASIAKACKETISALGKIALFVVFVCLIAMLFAVLCWLFALALVAIDLLGLLLLALLTLAGFYLYTKLVFTVQALGLEQLQVKQALQQSWNLAVGRFWHIVLFLLILTVVTQAIVFVGSFASDLVLDDLIGIVILAVFWAISLAFTGTAMALYYAEKKLGKST